MKTVLKLISLNLAVAGLILLPLLLLLDFLQPAFPGPVYLLLTLWALIGLLFIYIDRALSSRMGEPFSRTVWLFITAPLISLLLYSVQQVDAGFGQRGLLASAFDFVGRGQVAIGMDPVKTVLARTDKTATAVTGPEKPGTDIPGTDIKEQKNTPVAGGKTAKKDAAKPDTDKQKPSARLFYQAAARSDVATMKRMLQLGVKPTDLVPDFDQSLVVALVANPSAQNTRALALVAKQGLDLKAKFDVKVYDGNKIESRKQTLMKIAMLARNVEVVTWLKQQKVDAGDVPAFIERMPASDTEKDSRLKAIYKLLTGREYKAGPDGKKSASLAVKDGKKAKEAKPGTKADKRAGTTAPGKEKTGINHAAYVDAVMRGKVAKVKEFLRKGASANYRSRQDNKTALLYLAAESARAGEIAEILLKAGANVHERTRMGETALFYHVQRNRLKSVRLLLKSGADVNARAKDGSTPLYIAARHNHLKIMKLLIERGAKIKIGQHNGMTPLIIASINGHSQAVLLLLQKGADPNRVDRKGFGPLDYARKNGHKKVVSIISQRN